MPINPNNTALDLSAHELRDLTQWPDSVIEEFLSLSRTLVQVSTQVNLTVNNVTNLTEVVTAIDVPRLEALITKVKKDQQNADQAMASLQGQIMQMLAKLAMLYTELDNLKQEVPPSLLGKLNQEIQARQDVEQAYYSGLHYGNQRQP
jgi:hypothetical protein